MKSIAESTACELGDIGTFQSFEASAALIAAEALPPPPVELLTMADTKHSPSDRHSASPIKLTVDEKLARGLTMAEVRAVLKGDREAGIRSLRDETHPIRVAYKPVAFRYQTERRPDKAYVDQLFERFDNYYGAAPGTVHREAAAPVDRRGEVGQSRRYVTLIPSTDDPGCRSLLATCTCLDVRMICASLVQSPLLEVELHAIERFHQRTRQGLVREALSSFASALLQNVGLYKTMAEFSIGLPTRSFAMPFADGLLMGHACDPHPVSVPPLSLMQFFGDLPIREDGFLMGTTATCRVATFLGPREMTGAQHELRKGILAIAERRSEFLQDMANAITAAPLLCAKASDLEESFIDRFEIEAAAFDREMRHLLARPEMTKALGSGRPQNMPHPRRSGAEDSAAEDEPDVGPRP